uniref:Si:ch211-210c8.7 n=1 Tax=Sparus aurata TaxID=8175 RepID=A0A671VET9_SPAAU
TSKGHFKKDVFASFFPVVIVLILLTVAALGFLLYRYLCHNKGDYRTTGELAPGEDPDEEYSNKATSEKKEYFI